MGCGATASRMVLPESTASPVSARPCATMWLTLVFSMGSTQTLAL